MTEVPNPGPQRGDAIVNILVRGAWDKLCESVREAGAKMIENPKTAVKTLRFLADKLEEHQGGTEEQE